MDGQVNNSRQNHHYTVFPVDGKTGNDDILDEEYDPDSGYNKNHHNAQTVPTQAHSEGTPIVGPARDSEEIPIGVPVVDSAIHVDQEEIKLNDNNRPAEISEPQRDPQTRINPRSRRNFRSRRNYRSRRSPQPQDGHLYNPRPQDGHLHTPLIEDFKNSDEYSYDMNDGNYGRQHRSNRQQYNNFDRRVQDDNENIRRNDHPNAQPVDEGHECDCFSSNRGQNRRLFYIGFAIFA